MSVMHSLMKIGDIEGRAVNLGIFVGALIERHVCFY